MRPTLTRPLRWLLPALLLLAAACSGGGAATTDTDDRAAAAPAEADIAREEAFGLGGAGADGAGEVAQDDSAGDREDATGDEAAAPRPGPLPTTGAFGDRVIKEGTISVRVDPGDFDRAFAEVVARAQALGGDVVASSSSMDDDGRVRGSLTVRVPVRSYEDLLTGIGDVGEITDRSITSQDVTAEFTDLESRLRHLRAQESFYLGLLDQAETVQDAIAVQQQLDDVTGQIEQITGRLAVLEDRTSFSTLTVRLTEAPAGEAVGEASEEPTGFAAYWATAQEVLVNVLGALLVSVFFAAPFVVLGLLGWLLWRVVRTTRAARLASPVVPAPHREPDPLPAPPREDRDPADVG